MGTTTLLSIEEFFNLPNVDAGKRELIEGELIELPPATAPHNTIADCIADALKDYLKSQGEPRHRARMEAGFEISTPRRSWLQPDVALLHPDQLINASSYYQGAPLIAIEVISPSNTPRNIDRKRLIYLAHGSEEVWVVYPETKTVTTKRAIDGVLVPQEQAITSTLLPGFRLDFTGLFRQP
jgi:Uma2 family endonuclease